MNISNAEAAEQLAQHAIDSVVERCTSLIDGGVNVVVSHDPIHPVAAAVLIRAGIFVIENAGFEGCELASRATGAVVIADVQQLQLQCEVSRKSCNLGRVEYIRKYALGEATVVEICGFCNKPERTIVVCAPTSSLLDECMRSMDDVVSVLCLARDECRVVGGGGAIEMALAAHLRRAALVETVSDIDRHGMKAMASALEILPHTLASNGGMDASRMVGQCRQQHDKDIKDENGAWPGVDLANRCVRDMVKDKPQILEPASLVGCMLQLASDVAIQILRIDENIMLRPRQEFHVPSS